MYGRFDNLTFVDGSGSSNPPGGGQVPEPASLILLGSGVAAIYKKIRR